MVERAERAGFGVALIGHAALFVALSLRLLTPPLPVPPPEQAIEVSLAPNIAMRQAAPPAPTPPAASAAPEQGPPEEAAVAEPQPAPVPAPKPAPAQPKPAPVKAADPAQLEADRAAKAAARAAWVEKVQAGNAAKAEAARAAAQQAEATRAAAAAAKAEAHAAYVEKVKAANAAKAEAARVAAARAETARVAANAARAEAAQAAAARAEQARAATAARAEAAKRARGSRLSNDFLKGLADTPSRTPSAAAPGATMSTRALADIASAIQRQIQPCALRQVNPAPGQAERIRVTLNLKLNRDGSLAAPPRVINHEGLDVDNRRYLDRVDDLAIAAFVGCAPLHGLPNDLYDVPNGWRSISLRFKLPE